MPKSALIVGGVELLFKGGAGAIAQRLEDDPNDLIALELRRKYVLMHKGTVLDKKFTLDEIQVLLDAISMPRPLNDAKLIAEGKEKLVRFVRLVRKGARRLLKFSERHETLLEMLLGAANDRFANGKRVVDTDGDGIPDHLNPDAAIGRMQELHGLLDEQGVDAADGDDDGVQTEEAAGDEYDDRPDRGWRLSENRTFSG